MQVQTEAYCSLSEAGQKIKLETGNRLALINTARVTLIAFKVQSTGTDGGFTVFNEAGGTDVLGQNARGNR
ncbi:hypothetical protein D3C84_1200390 [compost metagenome]